MGSNGSLRDFCGSNTYVGEYRSDLHGERRVFVFEPLGIEASRARWNPHPAIETFKGFFYDESLETHPAEEANGCIESHVLMNLHWHGFPRAGSLFGLRDWTNFDFEGLKYDRPGLANSVLQPRPTFSGRLSGNEGDSFWMELQLAVVGGALDVKPKTAEQLETMLRTYHSTVFR